MTSTRLQANFLRLTSQFMYPPMHRVSAKMSASLEFRIWNAIVGTRSDVLYDLSTVPGDQLRDLFSPRNSR
jgi:hypothetical protein